MADVIQFPELDTEPLDVAQSATDMGVYQKIGEEWSINSPIHPPDWGMVRRVRVSFDPYFVPLWITKVWRSPNGGITRTGHHVIGRCLPPSIRLTTAWKRKEPVHLAKPTGVPIEIRYPILPAFTLDGMNRERIEKGWLPLYQDFDNAVLRALQAAMWQRNNVTPEEAHRKAKEAKAKKAMAEAKRAADIRKQRLLSRIEFRKPKVFVSSNQRTFVSEGLLRLRALAGTAAAGE